jgi:hypothetical protein
MADSASDVAIRRPSCSTGAAPPDALRSARDGADRTMPPNAACISVEISESLGSQGIGNVPRGFLAGRYLQQMIQKQLKGLNIMSRRLCRALASLGLSFVALGAWWSGSSYAAIIPYPGSTPVILNTLLVPNATITVGDKVFGGFTYNFTGDMPSAPLVNVIPILDDSNGNIGLRFQGAFIDLPSTVGGSDSLINYTVTTNDANFLISDAHLQGNLVKLGNVGSISVTETFFPLGQNGQYTMKIFSDETATQLFDSTVFAPPVKTLNVQKDIQAIAIVGTQSVVGSFVDQLFSQTQIPEPATGLLLLSGLAGICLALRRGRPDPWSI